jgi:hypothetical protein
LSHHQPPAHGASSRRLQDPATPNRPGVP